MPNEHIAELISTNLAALPHPGRPSENEPPHLIPLAPFRTAGMNPDMQQSVENTARSIGEAVVHLIERDGSIIIKREELDNLRRAEDLPGDVMPVICTMCREPIVHLRTVNGRALAAPTVLGKVNMSCPHRIAEDAAPAAAAEATA